MILTLMQVSPLSFTKLLDIVRRHKPRSQDWGVFGKYVNNSELYRTASKQLQYSYRECFVWQIWYSDTMVSELSRSLEGGGGVSVTAWISFLLLHKNRIPAMQLSCGTSVPLDFGSDMAKNFAKIPVCRRTNRCLIPMTLMGLIYLLFYNLT